MANRLAYGTQKEDIALASAPMLLPECFLGIFGKCGGEKRPETPAPNAPCDMGPPNPSIPNQQWNPCAVESYGPKPEDALPPGDPTPDFVGNDFSYKCGTLLGTCTTYFNRRKTQEMYNANKEDPNTYTIDHTDAVRRACVGVLTAAGTMAATTVAAGTGPAAGPVAGAGIAGTFAVAQDVCTSALQAKADAYADNLKAAAEANRCFAVRTPALDLLKPIPVVGGAASGYTWARSDALVRSTRGLCLD
jgi:hypothetical protein